MQAEFETQESALEALEFFLKCLGFERMGVDFSGLEPAFEAVLLLAGVPLGLAESDLCLLDFLFRVHILVVFYLFHVVFRILVFSFLSFHFC